MSEIKISIDDQHLQAFLGLLQTLNYVRVDKVVAKGSSEKLGEQVLTNDATASFLSGLPAENLLSQAVKPVRKTITVEELIRESGYVKTDWEKVHAIGLAMDIPQNTEELIAQLAS